jgi:hypothetical protein
MTISKNTWDHRRVGTAVATIGALVVGLGLMATQLKAGPPTALEAARARFAKCIQDKTAKYSATGTLTTEGLPLFVGTACAGARENYRTAAVTAGVPNTTQLFDQIDSQAVAYIVTYNK